MNDENNFAITETQFSDDGISHPTVAGLKDGKVFVSDGYTPEQALKLALQMVWQEHRMAESNLHAMKFMGEIAEAER